MRNFKTLLNTLANIATIAGAVSTVIIAIIGTKLIVEVRLLVQDYKAEIETRKENTKVMVAKDTATVDTAKQNFFYFSSKKQKEQEFKDSQKQEEQEFKDSKKQEEQKFKENNKK